MKLLQKNEKSLFASSINSYVLFIERKNFETCNLLSFAWGLEIHIFRGLFSIPSESN